MAAVRRRARAPAFPREGRTAGGGGSRSGAGRSTPCAQSGGRPRRAGIPARPGLDYMGGRGGGRGASALHVRGREGRGGAGRAEPPEGTRGATRPTGGLVLALRHAPRTRQPEAPKWGRPRGLRVTGTHAARAPRDGRLGLGKPGPARLHLRVASRRLLGILEPLGGSTPAFFRRGRCEHFSGRRSQRRIVAKTEHIPENLARELKVSGSSPAPKPRHPTQPSVKPGNCLARTFPRCSRKLREERGSQKTYQGKGKGGTRLEQLEEGREPTRCTRQAKDTTK